MWRSIFLAVGICACVLGAECLVVDKAIFTEQAEASSSADGSAMFAQLMRPLPKPRREFKPPEWAPWSLLTGGAVILLYSLTIPGAAAVVSGGEE